MSTNFYYYYYFNIKRYIGECIAVMNICSDQVVEKFNRIIRKIEKNKKLVV